MPVNVVTSAPAGVRNSARSGGVTVAPARCDAAGCCVITHTFVVFVAVALTESDWTPMAAALSVCVPPNGPSVQIVVARPDTSARTPAGVTEPPPAVTEKLTESPVLALPAASVSTTVMGVSAAPAAAVWPPPVRSTMLAAGPVTMLNAAVGAGVSPDALAVMT